MAFAAPHFSQPAREVPALMGKKIFLERYRLSIGRNGRPVELHCSSNARSYRAQEIGTGREVAITIVSCVPTDAAMLERLTSNAAAAQTINHISIPKLYDFRRQDNELIYVTEYCDGHTAAAWVAVRGPFPIGPVLRIALQVLDAMNATAFQRLYHPALNPDNILLLAGQIEDGDWPRIKIFQWFAPLPDLAARGDPQIDRIAEFAAPEQLWGGQVDVRAEIYSLGATMWFLLTGTPPTGPVAGKLRGVPKIVRHLLERMLRVNPVERPQDPLALASCLQTCLTRVERRENSRRCLRLPIAAVARLIRPDGEPPFPPKPLAIAAFVIGFVMAAALVFSGVWRERQAGSQAQHRRLHAPAATEQDVTASAPPPLFAGQVVSGSSAEEPSPTEKRSSSPGIAPPAEGPLQTPLVSMRENEQISTAAADKKFAKNVARSADENAAAAASPAKDESAGESTARIAKTPRSTGKRVVSHSRNHSRRPGTTNHALVRNARRAQPIPKLHVGSKPAELIGTTSDGRWILSVSDSGRRFIVPPPPGYGP